MSKIKVVMFLFYLLTRKKCNINILTTSRSRAVVARQAHNLKVDVFKSILRNQDYNRPSGVVFLSKNKSTL